MTAPADTTIRVPGAAPLTPQERVALGFLVTHTFLTCAIGSAYAKIRIPGLGVYVTEAVLGIVVLLGFRTFLRIPRDLLTRLMLALTGIAFAWVLLAGVGPSNGAGAKALSFFAYASLYLFLRPVATEAIGERFFRAICIASICNAVLGGWQALSGSPLWDTAGDFEVTTTGSTRWIGGEAAMYSVFTILLVAFGPQKTLPRRTTTLVLLAAIAQLAMAQHRSGFVALAAGIVLPPLVIGRSAHALRIATRVSVVTAGAAVLYLVVLGGDYIADTVTRLLHTTDFADENISWRLLSWAEVASGVLSAPLGHGFSSWDFLFTWDNPLTGSHNSLLDLAYRVGVLGPLLLTAMPVTLLAMMRRRSSALTTERSALLAGCACLVALLVFANFNVVFETPYLSTFWWIFLALGAGSDDHARERQVRQPISQR